MELARYSESCCDSQAITARRNPSIRERLEDRKRGLEADLTRVNEALAALDQAPETARVLELISKV